MEDRGFFGSLFDLSFQHFVFPKLVTLIYILLVVFSAIVSMAWMVATLAAPGAAKAAALLAPLAFVCCVIYFRVLMEVIVVMFRIAEDVRTLARAQLIPPPRTLAQEIRQAPVPVRETRPVQAPAPEEPPLAEPAPEQSPEQ